MGNSSAAGPPDRSQPADPGGQGGELRNGGGPPRAKRAPSPLGVPAADWPVCPDGRQQRLRHPLGFRERNRGELELRVELGGDDHGVCQVIVDEHEDEVHVRVLVHLVDEYERSCWTSREYLDCPVRVWLKGPLGDRAVVDADTDEELLLYTPRYVNNVPRPDHGYRPARRR